MYWNLTFNRANGVFTMINRNMRCIEMPFTWQMPTPNSLINRNMRCIEISPLPSRATNSSPINRNMRCIEMYGQGKSRTCQRRLIETWDVLKWLLTINAVGRRIRLIETWDVLKYKIWKRKIGVKKINRNMRCIEIVRT